MKDHAYRINQAAQRVDENARMDEIERHAAPLFWVVIISSICVLAGSLYEDYQKHDSVKRDAYLVSTILARCANGQSVGFDNGILTCKIRRIIE